MHKLSPCPTHITHFHIHSMLKGGNSKCKNPQPYQHYYCAHEKIMVT